MGAVAAGWAVGAKGVRSPADKPGEGLSGTVRGEGGAEGGDRVRRDMATASSKDCPGFAMALICIRTSSASKGRGKCSGQRMPGSANAGAS